MGTAQAGEAGLSRTSASAPLLPARTPFEPAPIRNPGPTFQPATQSNLILGQTRAGKLLLHNNRTCADAICCAADSNQRHLLVDALPFEPSLGPNRAVVRWLIWAVERSAAHERVLIWARNDAADASDDVSGPQRGCQAGAMPAWTPFQRLGATANSRSTDARLPGLSYLIPQGLAYTVILYLCCYRGEHCSYIGHLITSIMSQ